MRTLQVIWGAIKKTHKEWCTCMSDCDEFATITLNYEKIPTIPGRMIDVETILMDSLPHLPANFAVKKETIYNIILDRAIIAGTERENCKVAGGGFDIWRRP